MGSIPITPFYIKMEIIENNGDISLVYFGWELDLAQVYQQELVLNIWEQRDAFGLVIKY